jgi:hypothetical protein
MDPGLEKKTSASRPPSDTEIAEALNAGLSGGSFGAGGSKKSPEPAEMAQVDEDRK